MKLNDLSKVTNLILVDRSYLNSNLGFQIPIRNLELADTNYYV